jgi:protein-tyrosine sulfotransferase
MLRGFRSRKLIFVLGCQRSGTTLLFLMLDSHRDVEGFDERPAEVRVPGLWTAWRERGRALRTCHKLPVWTAECATIRELYPKSRIVWVVRHPYAVVASMARFGGDPRPDGPSWLAALARHELARHRHYFPELTAERIAGLDDVRVGALLWKYKLRTLDVARSLGLAVMPVVFEALVTEPEATMRRLLAFLDLPWDPEVLAPELHHEGPYAGGARGERPIDASRASTDGALSPAERSVVDELCAEEMARHGYAPGGDSG